MNMNMNINININININKSENENVLDADCPGFVQQHEAPGSLKNIAYFQKVLQGYEGLVKDTTSAAWWLVKQSPHVTIFHLFSLLFRFILLFSLFFFPFLLFFSLLLFASASLPLLSLFPSRSSFYSCFSCSSYFSSYFTLNCLYLLTL